jgi:hypothetical protein
VGTDEPDEAAGGAACIGCQLQAGLYQLTGRTVQENGATTSTNSSGVFLMKQRQAAIFETSRWESIFAPHTVRADPLLYLRPCAHERDAAVKNWHADAPQTFVHVQVVYPLHRSPCAAACFSRVAAFVLVYPLPLLTAMHPIVAAAANDWLH